MKLHAIVADLETAQTAVEGGATVVQLRLKGATSDEIVERGTPFRTLGVCFVVNDDVNAAIALGADGVHLGQHDPGGELAMAAGLLIGRSVTTSAQAMEAEAEGATYVGAGPVWETPSKTDAEPAIGLDGLSAIAASVSIPVVAIGGIDASNARACIEAGADGVAVIRAAANMAEISATL
jgi:thiamine-phosphate pyrophosphorylase